MNYTCAIVEEEPTARATLEKYVDRTSFLELQWTAASAEEAEGLVTVDLLWVALRTVAIAPNSALMRLLAAHESVILTSVYPPEPEVAQLNPIAFLAKPVSFDAFAVALEKLLERST